MVRFVKAFRAFLLSAALLVSTNAFAQIIPRTGPLQIQNNLLEILKNGPDAQAEARANLGLGSVVTGAGTGLSLSDNSLSVLYGTSAGTALQGSTLGQPNGPAQLNSLGFLPAGDISGLGALAALNIGSGLTSSGGNLSANVTTVFGRTGAVVLQSSDVTGALGFTPITNALTSADILVGNGSNVAAAVAPSGDLSMTNAAVFSVSNLSHVTNGSLANSGLVNSSTTVNGQSCVLGSSCAIAALTGLTAGAGLTTVPGSTGGSITTTGTLYGVIGPNSQGGGTYTISNADQGLLDIYTVSGGAAVSLPQAGHSSQFLSGWYGYQYGVHGADISPTTSTINSIAKLYLAPNQPALIISDGSNYYALLGTQLFYGAGGGWSVQPQDGTTTGGNQRGQGAVDLQSGRTSASQVANGTQSFIGGGQNNTASATQCGILAGAGNTCSGTDGVAGGNGNTAGSDAVAFGDTNAVSYHSDAPGGSYGNDRGNNGCHVHGGGVAGGSASFAAAGVAQSESCEFAATGSSTSAIRLMTDMQTAGSANVEALANNSALGCRFSVVVRDTTTAGVQVYQGADTSGADVLLVRGSNAASTTMSSVTWTTGPSSGTITHPGSMSAAADTSNGGINIAYTPGASNTDTFHVIAHSDCVQVQ